MVTKQRILLMEDEEHLLEANHDELRLLAKDAASWKVRRVVQGRAESQRVLQDTREDG